MDVQVLAPKHVTATSNSIDVLGELIGVRPVCSLDECLSSVVVASPYNEAVASVGPVCVRL